MKIKTGLKAGESGGGSSGEVLTLENAPGVIRQGLEDVGLINSDGGNVVQAAMVQMTERQAAFESRVRGTQPSVEWFVDEEVFHNGIPTAARPAIKERIRAAFQGNRGEDEVFPGQNAARAVRCALLSVVSGKGAKGLKLSGAAKGEMTPVQFAKALYGQDHIVTKALAGELETHSVLSDLLVSDRPDRIGVTIPDAFLPGFVDFLRPRSVYLAAGPVVHPMDRGKLSLVVQTSGSTFGYVETENSPPPQTSLDFAVRNLVAKYLKGLVVWSIHALRRSGVVTEALILNDMLEGGADALDDAALLGDGTGAEPKGLRVLIDSAHVGAATVLTSSDSNAQMIFNVSLDFRTKLNLVVGVANITPGRMVLFMSYRDFLWFLDHRTNDGSPAYPTVASSGSYLGMPIFWTGKISTTEATPDNIGSTIIGADMTNTIMAEEMGIDVDVADQATIGKGDDALDLWSTDTMAAKLTAIHDFDMRRRKAGFVLTGVNYGGVAVIST